MTFGISTSRFFTYNITTMTRVFLSAFIVFHLLGVLVSPNQNSNIYKKIKSVYDPYLSALALKDRWDFFAPDPTFVPVFIDYSVAHSDGSVTKQMLPLAKNPFPTIENHMRVLSAVRFALFTDGGVKGSLVPYLCNINPDAESLKLWQITRWPPRIEEINSGSKTKITDFEEKTVILGEFFCDRS
jgi:hypothetical protein